MDGGGANFSWGRLGETWGNTFGGCGAFGPLKNLLRGTFGFWGLGAPHLGGCPQGEKFFIPPGVFW